MRIGLPVVLATAALVYGCVAPREPAPAPEPTPVRPVARPQPVPVPVPGAAEPSPAWADLPDTPGAWSYSPGPAGGRATFEAGGRPLFSVNCARPSRRMWLEREGTVPGATAITVQTTYGTQRLSAAGPAGGGTGSTAPTVIADVAPSSPLFDQIAFSRGHFTVDVPGLPRLVLPAQPELTRVAEDCRS